MKVLVATGATQGWRANDFQWTVEGELVVFPMVECDCGTVDDACGCRRSMVGMASSRACTTVRVEDRPGLDEPMLSELVADSLTREGWLAPGDPELGALAAELAQELALLARRFPPGTVLERRGDVLRARTVSTVRS